MKELIKTMDEFSQWLHDDEWSKNYTNSLWFHCKKMKDDFKFSEVYQLFLKSKEKQIEIMEDYSIWLLANNWKYNPITKFWENYENPFQYSFSEVYQLFLKSKEA